MNDLELVREFRQASPDPSQEDRDEARAALMARVEVVSERSDISRRRSPRRWIIAATAAAVIAVVIPLMLPSGSPGGADPAAAEVLHRLAEVASEGSAPALPQPGEYVYTRSEFTGIELYVTGTEQPNFRFSVPTIRRAWISPDGSGRIVEVGGEVVFPTAADEAAWKAAGSPDLGQQDGQDSVYEAGGLELQDHAGLSTDPHALRPQIEAMADKENQSPLESVADVLIAGGNSPELRSALFEVAATLPEVDLVGSVNDPSGRPGIAIAGARGSSRFELIFDQDSSALLAKLGGFKPQVSPVPSGAGSYIVPATSPDGWSYATTYLRSEVVDSTGPRQIAGVTSRNHLCVTATGASTPCELVKD